ncbi:hypothetical protein Tco_0997620, partial [Tanacetum coccineum]
ATYIPSRKQPDWKHGQTFSASGRVEDDVNSINMVYGPCNPSNMHLAPGSSNSNGFAFGISL